MRSSMKNKERGEKGREKRDEKNKKKGEEVLKVIATTYTRATVEAKGGDLFIGNDSHRR